MRINSWKVHGEPLFEIGKMSDNCLLDVVMYDDLHFRFQMFHKQILMKDHTVIK